MVEKYIITGHTEVFCIIGHPVEHSMSPTMWNPALQELGLDYVYVAFDVHPDNLEKAVDAVRFLGIRGANVTIPHKNSIIKFLDEIDPIAAKMGAINTVKNEGGYLKAMNTDAPGARKSLLDAGCSIEGKDILFLGSGGVARSLAYLFSEEANKIVLTDIIKERAVTIANEIKKNMDADIEGELASETKISNLIKRSDILINATPIGMDPHIDASPISKDLLHKDLFVFDVIYNPLETKLMKDAAEVGCETLGGLDMLINQGVIAFEWFTGKTPNSKLMKKKIIEFLGIK